MFTTVTTQVTRAGAITTMFVLVATVASDASPKLNRPPVFKPKTPPRENAKGSWIPVDIDGRWKWTEKPSDPNNLNYDLDLLNFPDDIRQEFGTFLFPKKSDLKSFDELYRKWKQDGKVQTLCHLMNFGERLTRGPKGDKSLDKGYCRVLVQVPRKENDKTVFYAEWKLGTYALEREDFSPIGTNGSASDDTEGAYVRVEWMDHLPWDEANEHPDESLTKEEKMHTRRYPYDSWFIHHYDEENFKKLSDEKILKDHPIHSPYARPFHVIDGEKYDFTDENGDRDDKMMKDYKVWRRTGTWPTSMKWWQKALCVVGATVCCPVVAGIAIVSLGD